jgi:integrase
MYGGPLAEMITEYVLYKRATGCKYIREARAFRAFDDFTRRFDFPEGVLPKHVVLDWTKKRPHEKPITQINRVNAMRRFGEFIRMRGHDAYVPDRMPKQGVDTYRPHIFSEDEVAKILSLADGYQSTILSPSLNRIVPVAFRILYGCGLRCSELTNLKIQDVDLENCRLTIRESKFRKDRIVPMAASLARFCADYTSNVNKGCGPDDYFLRNPMGGRYNCQAPYYWFRELLCRAGIPHGGKGKGPRLHDLRHTFAVHCLKRLKLSGKDMRAMLPVLSAYMGHCDLRGTQIYLRLTPDLFPHIAATMSGYFYGEGHDETD